MIIKAQKEETLAYLIQATKNGQWTIGRRNVDDLI